MEINNETLDKLPLSIIDDIIDIASKQGEKLIAPVGKLAQKERGI
jgi:hypothetical protein